MGLAFRPRRSSMGTLFTGGRITHWMPLPAPVTGIRTPEKRDPRIPPRSAGGPEAGTRRAPPEWWDWPVGSAH